MDQKIYLKYIKEYTLEALQKSNDDVSLAADYLEKKSRPNIFSKNRQEKKAALNRVTKVFTTSRERSLYVVLKSLGFDDLARTKI